MGEKSKQERCARTMYEVYDKRTGAAVDSPIFNGRCRCMIPEIADVIVAMLRMCIRHSKADIPGIPANADLAVRPVSVEVEP